MEARIVNREVIHNGYLKLENLTIEEKGNSYNRELVTKKDAVVGLIVNEENDTVVLVKQFRPVGEYTVEVVAGTIEENGNPIDTLIREIEEEIGYKVSNENITPLSVGYVSSGLTNEKYYKYLVVVNNAMKVSDGGGLDNENENIEVLEMNINEFVSVGMDEFDDKTHSMRHTLGFIILQDQMAQIQQVQQMQMDLQNLSEEDLIAMQNQMMQNGEDGNENF
jgi:8-oxo-dGTP pyrophosphatase MutT (NUDIX family)